MRNHWLNTVFTVDASYLISGQACPAWPAVVLVRKEWLQLFEEEFRAFQPRE